MPADDVTEILKQLTRINTKLDSIVETNKDHEERLRSLESQNGKKWESLSTTILTGLAAAVLGYFIGQIIGG